MHVYSFFIFTFVISKFHTSLPVSFWLAPQLLGELFQRVGWHFAYQQVEAELISPRSFFFCYYSRVVVTHHDYIRHFRSNRSRSKISQNHYEFTNFTFSLSRKSHVLFPFDLRGCTTPTNYHDFDDRSNPSCLHGPAELHTNPQKRVTALPHTFIIHRAWTRKKRN